MLIKVEMYYTYNTIYTIAIYCNFLFSFTIGITYSHLQSQFLIPFYNRSFLLSMTIAISYSLSLSQ
jgi:hypothetical protein